MLDVDYIYSLVDATYSTDPNERVRGVRQIRDQAPFIIAEMCNQLRRDFAIFSVLDGELARGNLDGIKAVLLRAQAQISADRCPECTHLLDAHRVPVGGVSVCHQVTTPATDLDPMKTCGCTWQPHAVLHPVRDRTGRFQKRAQSEGL